MQGIDHFLSNFLIGASLYMKHSILNDQMIGIDVVIVSYVMLSFLLFIYIYELLCNQLFRFY